MIKIVRNFLTDESGATAIEYGLIAGLVSVAAIFALTQLGTSLQNIFGVVQTSLDGAAASASGAAAAP
jgi:pilus assembly protein Flp/PilA